MRVLSSRLTTSGIIVIILEWIEAQKMIDFLCSWDHYHQSRVGSSSSRSTQHRSAMFDQLLLRSTGSTVINFDPEWDNSKIVSKSISIEAQLLIVFLCGRDHQHQPRVNWSSSTASGILNIEVQWLICFKTGGIISINFCLDYWLLMRLASSASEMIIFSSELDQTRMNRSSSNPIALSAINTSWSSHHHYHHHREWIDHQYKTRMNRSSSNTSKTINIHRE